MKNNPPVKVRRYEVCESIVEVGIKGEITNTEDIPKSQM